MKKFQLKKPLIQTFDAHSYSSKLIKLSQKINFYKTTDVSNVDLFKTSSKLNFVLSKSKNDGFEIISFEFPYLQDLLEFGFYLFKVTDNDLISEGAKLLSFLYLSQLFPDLFHQFLQNNIFEMSSIYMDSGFASLSSAIILFLGNCFSSDSQQNFFVLAILPISTIILRLQSKELEPTLHYSYIRYLYNYLEQVGSLEEIILLIETFYLALSSHYPLSVKFSFYFFGKSLRRYQAPFFDSMIRFPVIHKSFMLLSSDSEYILESSLYFIWELHDYGFSFLNEYTNAFSLLLTHTNPVFVTQIVNFLYRSKFPVNETDFFRIFHLMEESQFPIRIQSAYFICNKILTNQTSLPHLLQHNLFAILLQFFDFYDFDLICYILKTVLFIFEKSFQDNWISECSGYFVSCGFLDFIRDFDELKDSAISVQIFEFFSKFFPNALSETFP